MSEQKIVLTTAGSQEEARKIAHALVERRLAACVNILPSVESIYRWRDKLQTAQEWMLVIKTTGAAFARVRGLIGELHSYELPECVLLSIEDGGADYLRWISDSVRAQP
jgi:periplasmic divalent cation tolerance protein